MVDPRDKCNVTQKSDLTNGNHCFAVSYSVRLKLFFSWPAQFFLCELGAAHLSSKGKKNGNCLISPFLCLKEIASLARRTGPSVPTPSMQQYNDPHHLATASYHLTRHQSYDDQGTLDLTASDPLQYNSMFKFQNAAQPSLSGQPLQLGQQSFGQNPISNNDPDGQQRMSAQSSFTYPQHGFRPVSIPMNQQAMASSPFMSPQRQQLHLPTKMDHGSGNVNDQYSSFHTVRHCIHPAVSRISIPNIQFIDEFC